MSNLRVISEAVPATSTVYRELKGPFIIFALIPRNPGISGTYVFVTDRYSDSSGEYDFVINPDVKQPIYFPNGLWVDNLYLRLYNSTGGSLTIGVAILMKSLNRVH